jgi:hypothetical protein
MSDEAVQPEYVQVGEAPVAEARRLQALLERRGVALELAADPESCGSCAPTVALYLKPADLGAFQALLSEEHALALGDLKPVAVSEDAVFDSEKAEATCPACGTVFSTRLTECPDCGLGFGAV